MATANWAHSRQGFLIHHKVALSAAGAACSRQDAAVCRMAKRLTARYLHPPQGEIIHREDEPSTASSRCPPQDLPMHREGSSSTARQGDLAQSPSIHRKAAFSTAGWPSLPQGGTARRESPPGEGEEGAPPFSSQTGVRRGRINALAAGRPPTRALLLGVALADSHSPGISLSMGNNVRGHRWSRLPDARRHRVGPGLRILGQDRLGAESPGSRLLGSPSSKYPSAGRLRASTIHVMEGGNDGEDYRNWWGLFQK